MKAALVWMSFFFFWESVFLSVIESTFSLFVSLQGLCWEPEDRLWGSPRHRKCDALEATLCDIWQIDDVLMKTSLWPFFFVVVNIWDFVDLYFQSFCRIAFPFHLPPSFLLTGQLPRTSVADFSCWLSVPWTPSLQVFSSDMALFGRRICFVQFFGVCVCWTSHFVLHLFCRFCLFVHNYFFVAIPVSLTQPRWIIFRSFFHFYISLGPDNGAFPYCSGCAICPWFSLFLEDFIAFFWTQSFLSALLASGKEPFTNVEWDSSWVA